MVNVRGSELNNFVRIAMKPTGTDIERLSDSDEGSASDEHANSRRSCSVMVRDVIMNDFD